MRLEAEGLFEPTRKRPLPLWPNRIGVVTSSTGAVRHDIETVIARRWPLAEIILVPTPVQGEDAPPKICQAIDDLNASGLVEVIIVARGGGSIEDLWPFNDEIVARAIFASRVPVVSAIGHETDVTIADLVADQRAPPPSAAAELVVPNAVDVPERLNDVVAALIQGARYDIDRPDAELRHAELRLIHQSPAAAIKAPQAEQSPLARR